MGRNPPVTFGDWLQQRRRLLDLTRADLAQSVGCSISALRKIEAGERRPSKQLAGLLSTALKVPPEVQPTFIRVARSDLNLERLPSPDRFFETSSPQERRSMPAYFRIPVHRSPFVGRASELATLTRLLADPQCQLLTLTGMGGIGKTRLAIELAAANRTLFPGGIYFVSLASLQSPEFIVPAIAEAMKFSFSGNLDPEEQLLHHLTGFQGRSILFLFDNLEHLLVSSATNRGERAAELFIHLLQSMPGLKILVTSREPIHVKAEWTFELQGLPVPQEHLSRPEENSAVALFVQRARRVDPGKPFSPRDYEAIIHICQLVGGIPLAIELAAAWIQVLSCKEIALEIQANLDFLSTSMRDVPERHRSLRATFDHSWKLLSQEERQALCHLSVFHGGFHRRAVEQITGTNLHVLAGLVSKSLVRRSEGGRYDLHEVIRQFAFSCFAEDPNYEATNQAHSHFYLKLLSDREKELKSAAQRQVIQELVEEMDNLRAAWAWSSKEAGFASIRRALRCFGWLCNVHGWLTEGIEQLDMVLQGLRAWPADEEQQAVLGLALAQQGLLFFRKGRFDRAAAAFEESLTILYPTGRPDLLTDPLLVSGIILHMNGDLVQSQSRIEKALACAQAAGDPWCTAYACYNLGYIDSLRGRYTQGYEAMQTGLAMWRELGDPSAIAMGLNYISPTAVQLGRLSEAQEDLQESLLLSTEVGDRWGMGTSYRNLGMVALAQGNIAEAQSLIQKSLDLFDGFVTGWDIARSLIYLGEASMAAGDIAKARHCFLKGLQLASEGQSPPLALEAINGLAQLDLLSGDDGYALRLLRVVYHHPASTQQAKDRARQLAQGCAEEPGIWLSEAAGDGPSQESLESLVAAILTGTDLAKTSPDVFSQEFSPS